MEKRQPANPDEFHGDRDPPPQPSCFLSFLTALTLLKPCSRPHDSLTLPLRDQSLTCLSGVQSTLDPFPYCSKISPTEICPYGLVYPGHCPRPRGLDLTRVLLCPWGQRRSPDWTHAVLPAPPGGCDSHNEQPSPASVTKTSGFLQIGLSQL